MKRKIIHSILLCFMLVCGTLSLTACGKGDRRSLHKSINEQNEAYFKDKGEIRV